jgi:hypothetical protein
MTRIILPFSLAALVVVLGIGAWATNFTAYLGNDPNTCNNCRSRQAELKAYQAVNGGG